MCDLSDLEIWGVTPQLKWLSHAFFCFKSHKDDDFPLRWLKSNRLLKNKVDLAMTCSLSSCGCYQLRYAFMVHICQKLWLVNILIWDVDLPPLQSALGGTAAIFPATSSILLPGKLPHFGETTTYVSLTNGPQWGIIPIPLKKHCVCVCTWYILSTKTFISLAKCEYFWDVGTFRLVLTTSKGCFLF